MKRDAREFLRSNTTLLEHVLTNLTWHEQRKLLEQLRETLPVDNRPSEKGLFEKVKDYFL